VPIKLVLSYVSRAEMELAAENPRSQAPPSRCTCRRLAESSARQAHQRATEQFGANNAVNDPDISLRIDVPAAPL